MASSKHWLLRRLDPDAIQQIYGWEEGTSTSPNATAQLINGLLFDQSKQVRTSTLIIAAFNILAAFLTASSILYDSFWASKKSSNRFRARKFCASAIHPAETFPLVLSLGIIIQGCVFSASQSIGMSGVMADGCSVVAQFMFPAILLVPYLQVVFGIESALRAIRKEAFPPRRKYDVTICLAVVFVMTIVSWIPTHISQEMDRCFASLVWFVERYGELGLILLALSAGIAGICAVVIFWRLSTVAAIDQCQRIAASRMVYYMVFSVVSLAFVIPWFVTLTIKNPTLVTSMMATVVLNLQGLVLGILQLFLRSNTATTSFRPKNTPGWAAPTHEIRLFGPNELRFDAHILQPVSMPRSPSVSSRVSLVGEKGRKHSLDSLRSPKWRSQKMSLSAKSRLATIEVPRPLKIPMSRHNRKGSYSLFPTDGGPKSPTKLPTTAFTPAAASTATSENVLGNSFGASSPFDRQTAEPAYGADSLTPPPPLFMGVNRHRRDSSMASSATVQIGLRLSNFTPDQCPPLPAGTASASNPSPNSTPKSPLEGRPASQLLHIQTKNLSIPLRSPNRPSPSQQIPPSQLSNATTNATIKPITAATSSIVAHYARMKVLPPVPSKSTPSPESRSQPRSPIQLSPTVYSPAATSKKSLPPPDQSSPVRPTIASPNIKQDTSPDPCMGLRASEVEWI